MDIHPLIRHQPDPDHPGWSTWDLADMDRYHGTIGKLLVRAEGAGRARCRMFPDERHSNLGNVVHGGAILTFIDMALFAGGRAGRGQRRLMRSPSISSAQFLSPGRLGHAARLPRSSCFARPGGSLSSAAAGRQDEEVGRRLLRGRCASRRVAGDERGRRALPGAARGRRAEARPRPGAMRSRCSTGSPPSLRRRRGRASWARLTGKRAAAAARRLSVGRGRARQVDADGPRLRGDPDRAQAPGPFPRIHARGARAAARRAGEGGRATRSRRSPQAIAAEARLLAFDEMVINNTADAMILSRLFSQLLEAGVTIVTTSNRPPRDLYLGGLNRELFLPFIDADRARARRGAAERPDRLSARAARRLPDLVCAQRARGDRGAAAPPSSASPIIRPRTAPTCRARISQCRAAARCTCPRA